MNSTNLTTNCATCITTHDPVFDYVLQLLISIIGAGVGAIVGAYFGLFFARRVDREKEKEQRKIIKNLTLDAIIEELKTLQKEIIYPSTKVEWHPTQRFFDGARIHVITPAFESAVNSGNFSLLSPSLQTSLGYVYLRIRNCELYNDQIDNFYFTPMFANNTPEVNREATRLVTKFNEHMELLRKEITEILSKLESEKTSNQNSLAKRKEKE